MNAHLFLSSTLPPTELQDRGEPDTTSAAFKIQLHDPDPWSCFGFQDDLPLEVATNGYLKVSPCRPGEAMRFFPSTMADFQQSPSMNTSHQEPTVRTSQGHHVPCPDLYNPPRAIRHSQVLPQAVIPIANNGHHEIRQHVSANLNTLVGAPSSQYSDSAPSLVHQYIQTSAPPNRRFSQAAVIPPYLQPSSAPPLPPTILYSRAKRNEATATSHHQDVTVPSFKSSQATQPGLTTKSDTYVGTAQIAGYEPSMRLET